MFEQTVRVQRSETNFRPLYPAIDEKDMEAYKLSHLLRSKNALRHAKRSKATIRSFFGKKKEKRKKKNQIQKIANHSYVYESI